MRYEEGDLMNDNQVAMLGAGAVGTIEPDPRIARGEITAERVDDLAERLKTEEFYVDIDDDHGPNAAGGTFTLVVADALTNNRFRKNGENAADHAKNLYSWLVAKHDTEEARKVIPRVCIDGRSGNYQNTSVIGGHDDEDGPEGCGAQKKLGSILAFMANNGDALRKFAETRGLEIDDDTHDLIVGNAHHLVASGYASSGAELRGAFVEVAGEKSVTTLQGKHKEVVGALNTEKGKTLDRKKVAAKFGDEYQSFGVDVDALVGASHITAEGDSDEAYQKFVAAMYYQEATSLVLAGESLRITDR